MSEEYKNHLLEEGEHCGLRYVILHHKGHRNGYVCLPTEHPWFKRSYDEVQEFVEVHGGLTFSGQLYGDGNFWLGFDTAHSGDLPDPSLPSYDEKWNFHEDWSQLSHQNTCDVIVLPYVKRHLPRNQPLGLLKKLVPRTRSYVRRLS